jgi:hypothetical protein
VPVERNLQLVSAGAVLDASEVVTVEIDAVKGVKDRVRDTISSICLII